MFQIGYYVEFKEEKKNLPKKSQNCKTLPIILSYSFCNDIRHPYIGIPNIGSTAGNSCHGADVNCAPRLMGVFFVCKH